MSDINTYFQAAAGFSAPSLSELIRSVTFILLMVLMAIIGNGLYAKVSSGQSDPWYFLVQLVMLLMLVAMFWSVLY